MVFSIANKKLQFITSCLLFVGLSLQAQLNVVPNPTINQIVDKIIGPGFTVTSATLNCPTDAYGTFQSMGANLGLNDGVVLTSGRALEAAGANNTGSKGVNNGAPGDNQLDVLSGATTFDGCVLEMDLIPSCDTLRISYVFGSEEYPEFVGEEFNDVFAFFVSGPGIVGSQNVALIPGTTTAVSVNTVNATQNQAYYINNNGGNSIQYDGFTTVLEGKIAVQQCETYHLKLAVADVVDGIYESGVFIQGNSVKCHNEFISPNDADVIDAIEGCRNGQFSLKRSGGLTGTTTVNYTIEGSADMGVDYTNIATSFTFPAGDSIVNIEIEPIVDGIAELDESVKLIFQPGPCPIFDTITLRIRDLKELNSGSDISVCSGVSKKIGDDEIDGATYLWTPATGLNDPTALQPLINLDNVSGVDQTFQYIQTAQFGGCESKDTIEVTIYAQPVVDITGENECFGDATEFEGAMTIGTPSTWQWDFGDNYISLEKDPSHTYASDGDYKVELITSDDNGCRAEDSLELTVWSLPYVEFSFEEACAEDSIQFTNNTTGNMKSFSWDFEVGSSNLENPKFSFSNPNIYNVELIIESDSGCIGSKTISVNVRSNPLAGFLANEVCLYSTTEFEELASIENGVITKYKWGFGDGSTDTINKDPEHVFATPGIFDVQLIALSAFGCSDTINQDVLVKDLPNAAFTGKNACLGSANSFTDLSQGLNGESITNWKWNFDKSFISTDQNPTIEFADTGIHEVILIATTNSGCADTMEGEVKVLPNPLVDFGPQDVCEGEPTVFNNKSSVVNPTDTIKTFIWDFGDGGGDVVGYSPVQVFNEAKEFAVTLTATTDSGCVSSKTIPVYVHGKPKVDFEAEEACLNFASEFSNKTTVSDGYIQKVYWDFDGAGIDTVNNFPSFSFLSSGQYNVKLRTVSNFGCIDSVTKAVVVNDNPVIDLDGADDHCLGKEIMFNASSISNPNGGSMSYKWAFGDGGVQQTLTSNTSHKYDLVGKYYVSLVATDLKGCKDTITDSLIVTGTPEIKFTLNDTCLNDTTTFLLEIEEDNNFNWVDVVWDFGDGNTDSGDTLVSHTYSNTGEYSASATLYSDSGCVVKVDKKTIIYDFPIAKFTVDTVCFGDASKFLSKSSAPFGSYINYWEWTTSYVEKGNGSNFSHVMQNQDADSVTLIVATNNGCKDTVNQKVYTHEAPEVEFTVGTPAGCAPFCVTMTSDIKTDQFAITDMLWDLGNGNISIDTTPEFCFDEPGQFSVELSVTNESGCVKTTTVDDAISVMESPAANFYTDYTVLSEFGASLKIFNTAATYKTTTWYMGDGTVIIGEQDFQHYYDSSGSYLLYQVVENDAGCKDTARKFLFVKKEEGLYIPNTFIADGRPVNGTFHPFVYGDLREAEYEFVIYNRWGEMVFITNDINAAWDGTYFGRPAQQDVYVWKLRFLPLGADEDDFTFYKGHVNLLR